MLLLLAGCLPRDDSHYLIYDVVLGCSGMLLTYTAAQDFPHRTIRNAPGQSGTLSEKATVTQAEMMEHLLYQFLNLWQALYLHSISYLSQYSMRWCALLVVTAPWYFRHYLPVHSFQQNWQTTPLQQRTTMETILYKVKKGQYLFYKHVVLHGLNLTLCVKPVAMTNAPEWRIFWLCLNTSYVMEFFLQSLVKRRHMDQSTMLLLNRWLMLVSSVASLRAVLTVVRWDLCALSLLLQFRNRHHDVLNTMLIATAAIVVRQSNLY